MSFSFGEGNVEFASPVGRISSLLGLGNHFRTKLVRLLGMLLGFFGHLEKNKAKKLKQSLEKTQSNYSKTP